MPMFDTTNHWRRTNSSGLFPAVGAKELRPVDF
jgi:hypothetical protein